MAIQGDTLLSVRQVGARLSVSVATVWRWLRDEEAGFPRPVRLSPGCTRFRASDIDAWVGQREGRAA